jgi:hypothetical protein
MTIKSFDKSILRNSEKKNDGSSLILSFNSKEETEWKIKSNINKSYY